MRKLLTVLLLFVLCQPAFASHIVGGEMIYTYLGPGSTPNTSRYTITLRLFRDQLCPPPCAPMPTEVYIGIFNNADGSQYPRPNSPYSVNKGPEGPASVGPNPACVVNPPTLNYNIAEYSMTIDLPNTAKGYTAAYQTCCRINPLTNVFNTGASGSGTGSTYSCTIPGTDDIGSKPNNSPVYSNIIPPICQGKPFTMDFSVTDADNDSIVYVLCEAYDGGRAQSASPINPDGPSSYKGVPYINGYSPTTPLGIDVTINAKTGIISGIAPPIGRYVVAVCAYEYRNGRLINIHRKDFIVNVANCDYAGAQLEPNYTFCNSLTASFQNLNSSQLNENFFWDFGDGDTSIEAAPQHTYRDTGTYRIKLVVNRGKPCGDSATALVRVYPFFNADFSFAGGCINRPSLFTDRTTATYGTVVGWQWNFGDTVATTQNPQVTFRNTGPRNVQLIATSSKGCQDTIQKQVLISDRPTMDVAFRDTLICRGDQVQLEARGLGDFSWTPNLNITRANTATPVVSPTATTSYVVKLDNAGCINFDTVRVRVVDGVTLQGRPDTLICATDSIQLGATTNGVRYQWTPATGLSDPTVLRPRAAPATTTTYRLTSFIGNCRATDDIVIRVAPYPQVNAGADTLICFGTEAQLRGNTNGDRFTWTPSAPLLDPGINPRIRPAGTQAFVLTAFNNEGCPKPARDTVTVGVLPPVQARAGNDTSVVIGQPLQFQASGGIRYRWSPPLGLNDPGIANPIAIYDAPSDSIRYTVVVANEAGCIDSASLLVKVFLSNPRIFVPTAFTPNNDGNNDVFRIIPVGMNRINWFRVYNRWGQLVFQSMDGRTGWDGRINGALQGTGTYVWLVQGIDFSGKIFMDKGTVTLIR